MAPGGWFTGKEVAMNDKPFDIPADMRAFADRSVAEAKQAFERYIKATQTAVSTLEGQAKAAQSGAEDVRDKAAAFAEKNVTAAFDLAQKLVHAKDPREISQLHAEFLRNQMQSLADQAKAMGETVSQTLARAMPDTKSS
jgi:phasin